MNPRSKLPLRLCRWFWGWQNIPSIPEFSASILTLMASFVFSGCVTHLGYVPNDVYAGCFWPRNCTGSATNGSSSPSYLQVKNWALQVADGYDTRAVLNRQAIYVGALIAAASTSAIVGLAAFDTANNVVTALPIGATFLGGTMAIYNNEQKAVIYGSASQTIRDVLIQSDYMQAHGDWKADSQSPICLHVEVSEVIRKVNNHISLLDPKNVADRLKGVAASVQSKQTAAVNKQADALAAEAKAKDAQAQAEVAQTAANKAPKADQQTAQQTADDARKLAAQANRDASNAATEANTANAEAKTAQDENTVQSVAAAANDFSDLQQLPKLEDMPEALRTYCSLAAAKQAPGPSASGSGTPTPVGGSL